ncbi:MAG: molybdenum cofactor guanylyltransferase [Bacillota bacterium]|nr:MAG: molybdenum cofactor guanylyltransferase [Bacillota bacterium]
MIGPAHVIGMAKEEIRMREFSAVVLNGGKSSRLSGQNKGLLRLGGITILERIVDVLSPLFPEVLVISNYPEQLGFLKGRCPIFQDEIKGLGPLGGIYTGLKKMRFETGFFVACDMPFLNPELILTLLGNSEGADVVCPRIGEFIEPLHAVYSKKCIAPIEDIVQNGGKRRVRDLFARVKTRFVDLPEGRFYPEFLNINTWEDFEKAKGILQKSGWSGIMFSESERG